MASMGKRGMKSRRKVKGRRRFSSQAPIRNNATRYQSKRSKIDGSRTQFRTRKPRAKIIVHLSKNDASTDQEPSIDNDFNRGQIEFLPIDQVSMGMEHSVSPPPTAISSPELLMITVIYL